MKFSVAPGVHVGRGILPLSQGCVRRALPRREDRAEDDVRRPAHALGRPARPRRGARAFSRLSARARRRVDLPPHRHRAALDRDAPAGERHDRALRSADDPAPAEGRAAPAHRRDVRARADLRARRAQPRRAAVRVGRRAAPRVRVHRPAVVPRPVLRRDGRAAHGSRLRRARARVLRARAQPGRGARGAVLRPAGAHRARRAVRDGHRRLVVGGARQRAALRHHARS